MTTHNTCPGCDGIHLPSHPKGPITFRHAITCELQAREDKRALGDLDALELFGRTYTRTATNTERTLLTTLGHTVPDDAPTVCQRIPGGIRRTFPTLPNNGHPAS